jgi:hypothetical protein
MSCKKQELLAIRVHLGSFPVFGSVCVAHLFSIMCCVFLCFVCLRPVSGLLNVSCLFGLSILDCPFGFI